MEEGGPERWQCERPQPDLIGFGDGGRQPTDEGHERPLKAGERNEMESTSESPERNTVCRHLGISSGKLFPEF